MDFESVKKLLERRGSKGSTAAPMPRGFVEHTVMRGLRIDRIEPGRVICSFTVSDRLVGEDESLHPGALATMVDMLTPPPILTRLSSPTTGAAVEISVSYLNRAYLGEEIEIESRALQVGSSFATVCVDFRSKTTGKAIAQGRHTSYLVAGRSKI